MSNKLLLTFALIGIIAVFSCGLLLPMPIGFKVSMITAGVMMIVMFSIIIPFDRKHIVRKKGNKIDFTKTKVYFRWNVFDTISVCLALYACICVQVLIFLVPMGFTIQNPYVQFFTNQSQLWVFVAIAYLISRISLTLKGIKEIKNHGADWD
ncbi:TPA: hypothetical protein QC443_000070 [Bacillus cereus]|uniref:hypothetical protein n=1 Tax=Bacillus cereus group TaxID=86661 RepID=UPI001927BB90|nr:hypothetical protein [Bacillus cereus]MBL3878447.1 hypothetical protein [Bacillus cereus]BCD07571.1 hypothetical protein BC30052_4626 [Bacillus cereus]HDR7977729.1 hypothetical protein [Bacillus cereus]HDR8056226.1 hypothetical protein [Bacillus cereus]HDR8073880.1 hypothetical protein [Bacillus cereus]